MMVFSPINGRVLFGVRYGTTTIYVVVPRRSVCLSLHESDNVEECVLHAMDSWQQPESVQRELLVQCTLLAKCVSKNCLRSRR